MKTRYNYYYCDEVHGMCVLLYTHNFTLRSKCFYVVLEQRRTKKTRSILLLTPFFVRSLTLIPRSLIQNRTETFATQATHNYKLGKITSLLILEFCCI